jgi:hypothetical protein
LQENGETLIMRHPKNFVRPVVTTLLLTVFASLTTICVTNNAVSAAPEEPYDPKPLMATLEATKKQPITDMHFLAFGDSKLSSHFETVLKRADALSPEFNITTADLVSVGGGTKGISQYQHLDQQAGWFFRKYPTWPSVGNHELIYKKTSPEEPGFDQDGYQQFASFFGINEFKYNFSYGNATFIALDWPKIEEGSPEFSWLESTLQKAQGTHIFIFKHRPYYTVGTKSRGDVLGEATSVTKLFTKYKVTAVFSGHDHTYYRTKRDGVYYVISAGAGAGIYPLKREADAIAGDVYYGRNVVKPKDEADTKPEAPKSSYRIHTDDGQPDVTSDTPMYFVVSVKIKGDDITFTMIQADNGKVWDEITFNQPLN